jgi:hypothetical protein
MSSYSSPNGLNLNQNLDRTSVDTAEKMKTDSNMNRPIFLQSWSEDETSQFEARLRRKIDLRLLPMVIIMYIMNYLDRNNIASARIAGPDGKGMQDELGLSSTQYQVCSS